MYICLACDREFASEETECESLFGSGEAVAMCPLCGCVVEWEPPVFSVELGENGGA